MNKKTLNMVLMIVTAGLGIAGLVFVLISIFTEHHSLMPGMLCIVLGNLCNLIRMQMKKKGKL